MSDALTNLLTANRSSTVLQGIANPAQVNPLAAMTGAAQTAGAIYDIRTKQAQQAWGQALQQATDANGNVDYPLAQSIAAKDPLATMGMATNLRNNAELQSAQIANAANHQRLLGVNAMSVATNPSDANVNASFDNLTANGVPSQQVEAERQRWLAMSPAERQQNAVRVGLQSLDQLHQVIGQTTGVNVGDRYIPLTTTQPTIGPNGQVMPGSMGVGAGGATLTVSPEWANSQITVTDNKGNSYSTTNAQHLRSLGVNVQVGGQQVGGGGGPGSTTAPPPPPRGTTVVTPPASSSTSPPAPNASGVQMGGVPPPPPGAPGGTSSAPVSAGQAIGGPAPLPVPPTPPAAPPDDLNGPRQVPPIGTSSPYATPEQRANTPVVPGRGASLAGGVPVASTNALAPGLGAPSAPSPAVSGDVATIMAGMRGSPPNALAGGTATAGPGGGPPAPSWGTTSTGQPFIGSYGGGTGAPAPTTPPPAPAPTGRPAPAPATAATPPGVSTFGAGGRGIAGPAPGFVPAAQETGKASAAMGNALVSRGDQAPINKANYANMLTDLQRIGNMPAGSEREVAINTFLQKATGYGLTMSAEQIAGANSFAKLANIAIGQQLAAIGGTDARQALFMGSNPNMDLSKLGNTQIIHMLQGNEDAIQAKASAWQDWLKAGNGPDTYGRFQNDFNHHFDPRVFQSQYMAPDEIQTLRKSMSPGEARAFVDDVRYAREQGWIK